MRGRFASDSSPMKRRGDLVDLGGRVDQLVGRDAGDRRAEDDARARRRTPRWCRARPPRGGARSRASTSTSIQCSWMFWRSVRSAVSRPNSVEMPGDHAQLLGRQLAAVDADAQHEVLVLELVRLEGRGPAAVDAGLALRVQPPHAEAPVQVGRVDRGEPALRVDVLDALAHGEAVVDLLPLLVAVERGRAVDLPLPVGLGRRTRRTRPGGLGGRRALRARSAGTARTGIADRHGGPPQLPGRCLGRAPSSPHREATRRWMPRHPDVSRAGTGRNAASQS